jgi:Holliday junction DNA helicase RuvB
LAPFISAAYKYDGGPVGIETLEEVYEPFLIQEGFIQKTPHGRILTGHAKQLDLFGKA